MNLLDSNIVRQPAALLAEGLETIPEAVTSLDLGDIATDIASVAGDVVDTATATGGRAAWRTANAVVRHRRGIAYSVLVIGLAALGARLYKQRQEARSDVTASAA